jgi:hypothetical protein
MNKIPKILILIWCISIPAFLLSFVNVYKKNQPIVTNELLKLGKYKFAIKTDSKYCIGTVEYDFTKEDDSTLLIKSVASLNINIKEDIPILIKSFISFNPFLQLGSSSFSISTKNIRMWGTTEGINKINYKLNIDKNQKKIFEKIGILEGPIELKEIKENEFQIKNLGFISNAPKHFSIFNKLFKIEIVPFERKCKQASMKIPMNLLESFNSLNLL